MGLQDFYRQQLEKIDRRGIGALPSTAVDTFWKGVGKIPKLGTVGTNVFSKEWDVLVILDACRHDVYQEEINSDAESIWSVGSTSEEWIKNTFWKTDTGSVAYITGNMFSRDLLRSDDLETLAEVWTTGWDDELGTIPPEPITDRAISTWREGSADRMVVHYMQPHFPAIGSDIDIGGSVKSAEFGEGMGGLWESIQFGEVDHQSVWEAYRDNLQFVWDNVQTLMQNVDGTVAISADHGNSFGEMGLYGHPPGIQVPQLRRVPWDIYECEDHMSYSPSIQKDGDTLDDTVVKERLEKLGYV